jgi:uncharacterized protein (TIGR00297 family)
MMSIALRIASAAPITLAFTLGARALRGVTRSGALAGAVLTFLLCVSAGLGAFGVLVGVFLLAYVATKLGRSRKEALGTAERREGRSASQVVANLAVGTLAASLSAFQGHKALLLSVMTAAFAEAAADTVSSEIGQAVAEPARLITNWEVIKAGTDGGVTLTGTVAGAFAAAIIGTVSALTGLIPWRWVPVASLAGVLGMLLDSVLGATLERKALLNNDQVNFLGTLAAALVAFFATAG